MERIANVVAIANKEKISLYNIHHPAPASNGDSDKRNLLTALSLYGKSSLYMFLPEISNLHLFIPVSALGKFAT